MKPHTGKDSFGARALLPGAGERVWYYRLQALEQQGGGSIEQLPFSVRILLESLLRGENGDTVCAEQIVAAAGYDPAAPAEIEIPYLPSRVLLQDFTGVPCVVDLAAMRAAMARLGGDPARINPRIPVDLVIDHSLQVDHAGTAAACQVNTQLEFARNAERYAFLKWGQQAFESFRVVPPGQGICHQVNLEYLASVVRTTRQGGDLVAVPDTLVGTDSHTTMINGLGVAGWGVGGIEAEAVMLGQPLYMLMPPVVGMRLTGRLRAGVTATDLVLTVTDVLRQAGVVGSFVEFFGPAVPQLSIPDRATVANMAPEYGATMGFFAVDEETLAFLRATGRSVAQVDLIRAYCQAQTLLRSAQTPEPVYSRVLECSLDDVAPCCAGPSRPQDRILLTDMAAAWQRSLAAEPAARGFGVQQSAHYPVTLRDGTTCQLTHGSVVLASITSCTNTSNPSVMLGAGLLAQRAVAAGLQVPPWVKTSLIPGSTTVTEYLDRAGLLQPLAQLGFDVAGYGCATCIGNSGPLDPAIESAIGEHGIVAAGVVSGNRNFEGRLHSCVRASYLASPLLVIAYALAGSVARDFAHEPLGIGDAGQPVMLRDIWPGDEEIAHLAARVIDTALFERRYAGVEQASAPWNAIAVSGGSMYAWDPASTYIQEPSFLADIGRHAAGIVPITGARVLAVLGDSITTDHISPAGSFAADSPAGRYLQQQGVSPEDFNSYGSRRGNHQVMMRGTFANVRLRNRMVPDREGGWTRHVPSGETLTIYAAAERYRAAAIPLVVLAGRDYGMGSSRDWAAKGTALLGVRAVIARSFERIHRSNLVGMGVLPLQFAEQESVADLGLDGSEEFNLALDECLEPGAWVSVEARRPDGARVAFAVRCRLDSPVEVEYYRHGGILPAMLRRFLDAPDATDQ